MHAVSLIHFRPLLWLGLEPGRKLPTSPRLAFMLPWFMAKTLVTKKKRGPPATGQGLQIGERWHPPEVAAIDAWIKAQGGNLTRGHAIRRLVALGLTIKAKPKQPASSGAERAKELAAKAIDKMTDAAASADDQTMRKRRLLNGPEEFRENRVDRKKAKK